MPIGNISAAVPVGVLPQTLSLAFEQSETFPMLSNTYHDGASERSLITDGINNPMPIKSWRLNKRLSAVIRAGQTESDFQTLKDFFVAHQGGLIPFLFYNPFENDPGSPIGSNYDATGDGVIGRYTVKFTQQTWSESTGLAFSDVPLEFIVCG